MKLRNKHKKAARYLVSGVAPTMVAELVHCSPKEINQWRVNLDFKEYMRIMETKYLEALDADIERLKHRAFEVLYEAMNQTEDQSHLQWAVNRLFLIDQNQEKNINLNQRVELGMGKEFDTPEQKQAAKEFLLRTADPSRYGLALTEAEA